MVNRFVIADAQSCIGCYTCEAGCVSVHAKAGLVAYPRLNVMHTKAGTMPLQCRQCDDAPCEKVCPVKAITFEDHAVQLNEGLCIGCKMCALACPFGAITPYGTQPNAMGLMGDAADMLPPNGAPRAENPVEPLLAWTSGERTVAVKCDLCYFLPQGPECIRVCPTNALRMVDEDALAASSAQKRKDTLAGFLAASDLSPQGG
jgi:hydrogenase-4 component A